MTGCVLRHYLCHPRAPGAATNRTVRSLYALFGGWSSCLWPDETAISYKTYRKAFRIIWEKRELVNKIAMTIKQRKWHKCLQKYVPESFLLCPYLGFHLN